MVVHRFVRRVRIGGEDIVEEEPLPEAEALMAESMSAYDEETPLQFTGNIEEAAGDETLIE